MSLYYNPNPYPIYVTGPANVPIVLKPQEAVVGPAFSGMAAKGLLKLEPSGNASGHPIIFDEYAWQKEQDAFSKTLQMAKNPNGIFMLKTEDGKDMATELALVPSRPMPREPKPQTSPFIIVPKGTNFSMTNVKVEQEGTTLKLSSTPPLLTEIKEKKQRKPRGPNKPKNVKPTEPAGSDTTAPVRPDPPASN